MTPGLYELGGKSANIVFPDAPDLDAIAAYSVGYAFTNAGQGCTCPTRLIVHDDVYDALLEKVVAATGAVRVGDPLDAGCDMGPVVNTAAMERITGMIARASADSPQALVCGGERLDGELGYGNFLSPGIFAGVRPDSEIASQEIFGPVLSVLSFGSEEEALAIANGTSYALAAYVQTADIRRAHRFVRALRAGGVYINRTFTLTNPANTTGGIGQPTPEGAHRDGVDVVVVMVVDRQHVIGGETRVFAQQGTSGVRFTLREPWTALILDDERVVHETTAIRPDDGPGHRDTLVLTFRRGGFQDPPGTSSRSAREDVHVSSAPPSTRSP
jgi:acyl-CoA reductase-like NAD-dependent aldehyde dehydrogenase